MLILGLAPGAHGANRTGRVFTGDEAGYWLYGALCKFGFANLSYPISRNDGLELRDAYITNIVKCAPPNNSPGPKEIRACSKYLIGELALLKQAEVVLTLGEKAFNTYRGIIKAQGHNIQGLTFAHGSLYRGEALPHLVASYHPSAQVTRTKRLTLDSWHRVFEQVRGLLG